MGLGNLVVVAPKKGRASRQSEMTAKRRIAVDTQQFFDVALGELHDGGKSRPLDFKLSSALACFPVTVSKHMDTMGQRLRAALEKREMQPKDLIKTTRLSRATIYFVLGGPTKPEKITANTVEKICRALRIRREWLLKGEPPMNSDSDKTLQRDTQAVTAADLAELQAVTGLIAQALAASIQPVGKSLLAALKDLPKSLQDRDFVQDVIENVQAELPDQSITRPAPRRAARKPR